MYFSISVVFRVILQKKKNTEKNMSGDGNAVVFSPKFESVIQKRRIKNERKKFTVHLRLITTQLTGNKVLTIDI